MNSTLSLSIAALLTLASASAHAQKNPVNTGSLAVPANRVVGMWSNASAVGPCGGPAVMQGHNTVTFSPGGTLVDVPRAPAGIALQRSIGLGTWAYDPLRGNYTQRVRFDWFLNGAYDGYQTVDRGATSDSRVLGEGGHYYLLGPASPTIRRPSEMPADPM